MRNAVKRSVETIIGSESTADNLIQELRKDLSVLIESLDEADKELGDSQIKKYQEDLRKALQDIILIEHALDK
jgi:hypothetical protein